MTQIDSIRATLPLFCFILRQLRRTLLMLGLEPMQILHGVCLLVIVNYIMMTTTHQDQIVIPVAFFWCLIAIKARACLIPCLDVADFSDNCFAINGG